MHTISELGDLRGKRVLLRADLNVPLEDADGQRRITDDGRIRATVATVQALTTAGARVVIAAHLGRPKGGPSAELSLAPVAIRLAELLGAPVALAADVSGASARETVAALGDGDVALLENVRFDDRETSKDAAVRGALAAELAALADVYVSDGFGVVHREQASVTDVARLLPRAAGLLVEAEVKAFDKVLNNPDRPYAVVLGGAKVADKLAVIGNLLANVDRLLVGGGMAYTFLAAQGFGIGNSLFDEGSLPAVRDVVAEAERRGVELVLPVDVVVATEFSNDSPTQVVAASEIPDGWQGLDIGPATRELFASKLADARTIVWNGPLGVFEMPSFAEGTKSVALAISAVTATGATTVIGGGDSAAAVRLLGIEEAGFTHISTGGGASLELLEGKVLPGLSVLND
jgi:phosphoglycerate kinase